MTLRASERSVPTDGRSRVQTASAAAGAVFLLMGVLGFIPGITVDTGSLSATSPHSEALLFGVFHVSILHNLVHVAFGIFGVTAGRDSRASRRYLIIGGVVYLALFIYGLLVPMDSAANFVPVNGADNVLHVVFGVGMVTLGLVLGRVSAGGSRPAI